MHCNQPKTLVVLAGCFLWLAGLGWIDRVTGYELGLFAFYAAPVAVAAWNLGLRSGILAAFLASVIWYLADRYAGDRYSIPLYGYWNTGMHFTTFLINAATFAKIKSSLDQRHALERDLKETREQLKQLAGLTALCPQCRHLSASIPLRAGEEPREACRAIPPSEIRPRALGEACDGSLVSDQPFPQQGQMLAGRRAD